MSKPTSKSFTSIVVESLGWPLFWGISATCAFYLLIAWGAIQSELVTRYFAGHPVEYLETGLFFVGVVALVFKAADLAFQFGVLPKLKLGSEEGIGTDAGSSAADLLEQIHAWPSRQKDTYLGRRLANSLRYVHQSDSATGLDEQLRYLSDVDAERSHDGYSFVRMIIWATPMLGFLGTVIGITLALGNLSPEALIDTPKEAMQGLLAGLSVAFDTTALALSLSIILMFLQFLVREVESQLLTSVDRCVEDELVGRFAEPTEPNHSDPETLKLLSDRIARSVEQLSQRQTAALQSVVEESQRGWKEALLSTSSTVQENLSEAAVQIADRQLAAVGLAEGAASQRIADRWENIQQGMQEQASLLAAQHQSMMGQSDVLRRVLEATGEIQNLEKALNQNLSALAGAKNFQDTVVTLSVAIQLLTSRLGITPRDISLHAEQEQAA